MKRAPLLLLIMLTACSRPREPDHVAKVHIRAGTSGNYPPFSEWVEREARWEGFAPPLLPFELTPVFFKWPELTSDFKARRFDVAVDGITVRPERSVLGRFSVPIARGGAVLLLRRPAWANDTQLSTLDRPELRVVVNQGAHLEKVARKLLPHADLRPIPNNEAGTVFAKEQVDAAMTNTFEAPRWSAGLTNIERVGPLTEDITALWIQPDREDLAEQIDEHILALEAQGTLAKRRRELWGDTNAPVATPRAALNAACTERLELMPFVAAAKAKLNKPIEDTAQETKVIEAALQAVSKAAEKHHSTPPPRESVEAFFRAQIEAAKAVQSEAKELPPATFTLEELRPAIARVTAKQAFLLVRLDGPITPCDGARAK